MPRRGAHPVLAFEAEVGEQHVGAAQSEPPTDLRPLVPLQHLDHGDDGVAVRLEDRFGEEHPLRAAVALHLPFVGVELHLPQPAVGQTGTELLVQAGEEPAAELLRLAVEAQPQVPLRIAVADEEPAVRGALGDRLAGDGAHDLAQQAVRRRGAGVDLEVEPLGARGGRCGAVAAGESARALPRAAGAGPAPRGLRTLGHQDLVQEPALGTGRGQLVRSGKDLHQAGAVALFDDVQESIDREDVLEVDQQLVVGVDEGR